MRDSLDGRDYLDTHFIFPAVGAAGLAYYSWCAAMGLISRHWPVTAGRVTASSLRVSHARGSENYSPQVSYSYEVNGKQFVGRRAVFGPYGNRAFGGKAIRHAAAEAVERYAVGQVVEVHYSPRLPGLSVLEPGVTAQTLLWIGFIILASFVYFWLFDGLPGARGRLTSA